MKLNQLHLSPDAASGIPGTANAGVANNEPEQETEGSQALDAAPGSAAPTPGAATDAEGEVGPPEAAGDTATPSGGTGVSKEDLEAILERVIPAAVTAAQPAPQQPQPQYSQEDFDRMFNVWKPSAELISQLRSEDPKVAMQALAAMQQGIIRQAMTMAEYRIQQYRDALKKEYSDSLAPIQSFVTEQQATSFRNDFFKEHPDLEPYETIVDAVAAKLQAAGWTGKSRSDVMKRFADDSQAVVKSLLAKAGANGAGNGAIDPATGKKVVAFTAATNKRMSTLTGGGQGTTSGRGVATASKGGPPGIEVFD